MCVKITAKFLTSSAVIKRTEARVETTGTKRTKKKAASWVIIIIVFFFLNFCSSFGVRKTRIHVIEFTIWRTVFSVFGSQRVVSTVKNRNGCFTYESRTAKTWLYRYKNGYDKLLSTPQKSKPFGVSHPCPIRPLVTTIIRIPYTHTLTIYLRHCRFFRRK